MRLCKFIISVLAILAACAGVASATDGQQQVNSILNQTPYTYLLDTGSPSATALSEGELAQKTGWTIIPEDNLTHKFKGDTVFLNDKIMVVLRRSGSGAEVYSRTAEGLKERAQLFVCAGEGEQTTGLSSVRIIENTPAAVMLEAVFQTQQGKPAASMAAKNVSATYRLTTGQVCLEVSPGKGMNEFFIQVNSRYVVVPDFFADDVVFNPEGFNDSKVGLPAENFLLHMLEGNDAIVMCVWESDKQSTQAVSLSVGQGRVINGRDKDPTLQEARKVGTHIQCIKDRRIWVAFMEGSNIWHERLIRDEDKDRDIVLDWKPPFPAKWRADFIRKDELAESWNFMDEQETEPVSAGDEQGCFCWFDSDRSCVRVPELPAIKKSKSSETGHAWPVIVYPIDRSRATPLRVFCPIDILRNTLGVGPCQYILEKEGFGSDVQPTADQVTSWVENLFEKKKEKQAADQIEEHLKQMVEHMRQTQMRIRQYGDFARQVQKLRDKQVTSETVTADLGKLALSPAGKLWGIVDDLEQNIVLKSEAARPCETAWRLAEGIITLIGQSDAPAQCQKLCSQIRAVAAAQDRALSKSRMAVRLIRQQCMMVAGNPPTQELVRRAGEPQAADFAAEIQQMAEQMLQKK